MPSLLVCVSLNISGVYWGGPTGPAKKESSNDPNALPYTKDSRLMNAMSLPLAFLAPHISLGSLYSP